MSLKNRNLIAWGLILIAAVCWSFGKSFARPAAGEVHETTAYWQSDGSTSISVDGEITRPTTQAVSTTVVVEESSTVSFTDSIPSVHEGEGRENGRIVGYLLCFLGIGIAAMAVFFLWQKTPVLGPDGIGLCFALAWIIHIVGQEALGPEGGFRFGTYRILVLLALGGCLRELFGWIRSKFSLSWCLIQRFAGKQEKPQISLLLFAGWLLVTVAGVIYGLTIEQSAVFLGFGLAAFFGFLCLWMYGADLNHFKKQLDNYRQNQPVMVGKGAFAEAEARLVQIQEQHEKAVRAAVTGERFKVELISNVSHDLRTPLTSILGYSELLQKEALSPQGKEQLQRLHQKAGYMNELVEALFELTKVSSGVVESKKETIDLVRLLEQTIGLFDDQLTEAGLAVRRSYCASSIPVIMDGARMHQVFANLLGNAIKYALKGTRIYIEVTEEEGHFRVRMVNTSSYEMDFQPEEILQRFARGDKARTTKGSGLGLAIAQTYTESVGGSFRISIDGDQFSAVVELPKTERNL